MRSSVAELHPGEHICLIGSAMLEQGNPVRVVHEKLLLVLVVERSTGRIIDCEVNTTCTLTCEFIRQIFIDKNILTDLEQISSSLTHNYMGSSVKALITASKAIRSRLIEVLKAEQKQLEM